MKKFLFVSLLTISSASLCMDGDLTDRCNDITNDTNTLNTNDDIQYSSCDSREVDYGNGLGDTVSTSTQEMADYTFSQPQLDLCSEPSNPDLSNKD